MKRPTSRRSCWPGAEFVKVLSVIIAHPLRKIAGATNAGRELSVATAEHVDMDLAIMWDTDETTTIGKLNVRHVRSTSPLRAFERWLPRSFTVPLYGSRIPELIEDGDYDLVHIHNLLPAFAAEKVAQACRRRRVPYVISSHGFNEQSRYASLNGFRGPKKLLARWAIEEPFRRVVKGAQAIYALSDREGPLLSELGVAPQRVHVVTNGVNEYYLGEPSKAELIEARTKFGLGEDPILLFMGSLHGYKGLDVFLSALKHIQGPFQAVVAGRFRNDKERQDVLLQAGLGEAEARSVVFTNAVTDAELRALYHTASLFVYPTKGDTLPLVVLEAMACGLPIVSTTIAGIPFMVGPKQGVLVEPGSPGAIADAVNSLLANPALRESMSVSAIENVRTRFRWSLAARSAVEGYEAILASKPFPVASGVSVETLGSAT
jgi:glycosyltransferase involved in cell wall biosynthesis